MNFSNIIKGIHHVTATVDDPQQDYDFYVKLLGQRLIKETVNFDNENVYHFYYGNRHGQPSTVFTTFPYKNQDVRKGVIGSGQVYETGFSAPKDSLDYWQKSLEAQNVTTRKESRFGRQVLLFEDPSGLKLNITEDSDDNRKPIWETESVESGMELRGIHHVVMALDDVSNSVAFMEFMGYHITQTDGSYTKMESALKGAGNTIILLDAEAEKIPRGINGLGTVHHVAHRVESIEDSIKIREALKERFGIDATEIKDRKYFKSIYFKMPGGVIFEIATEGPGFLIDETDESLGGSLKLPDWQEPRRSTIELKLMGYHR